MVVSLVARMNRTDPDKVKPSFQIVCGSPDGRSYAGETAKVHGINREQLMLCASTKSRKVL